jgi:hypothetical protein
VRTWLFLASGVSLARRRDHEGEILEVLVQRRRDRRAAVKLGRNRSGRVGQVYTILADALDPPLPSGKGGPDLTTFGRDH